MNIWHYNNSFGCLPGTHVEASLKALWPDHHVRGCILKELLVLLFWEKVVRLLGGWSVINRAYPV